MFSHKDNNSYSKCLSIEFSGSPGAHGSFRNVSTPTVLCKLNTTCSLFCYLSSDEPVQYNWTKNGQPLTGDDVMIVENVLIVTPRKEDDYGVYVCQATNSAGSVEYEISLEGEANNGYRGKHLTPLILGPFCIFL